MQDEKTNDQTPPVLSYGIGAAEPGRKVGVIAEVLAIALPVALGVAGVASDRLKFPLPKKVGFTVASACIVCLLLATGKQRSIGCAAMLGLYLVVIGMMLMIMWFWN